MIMINFIFILTSFLFLYTIIDKYGIENKKQKNKLKRYRNSIYDYVESSNFSDISVRWVNFLKKDKRMKKNSYIIWNLGGRGSGKTATIFKETYLLLKDNPKRNVCFWKTPKALIENIERYCPDELIGRYRTIEKLRDIKQNDIFIIDEGLIGANAKEALKVEMRNLIKFLSKSRHLNIIGYINSISFGVLLQFRDAVDILVYRRLPKMFIKNKGSKDFILKTYGNQICHFKEHESLIISSYKRFEAEGLLSIRLEKYCPWFNDNISMYQQEVSADAEFDDAQKIQKENIKIVEWLLRTVGDRYHKVKGGRNEKRNMIMWLYVHHIDIYTDNKKQLNTIYDLYNHYIDESYYIEKEENKNLRYVKELVKEINEMSTIFDFSKIEDLAMEKARKTCSFADIERDYEIYLSRFEDKKILAEKYGITADRIYGIIRRAKGKFDELNKRYERNSINYHKGKIFEKAYKRFLISTKLFEKVILDGRKREVDITAYDDKENKFVFSLKNYDLERNNILEPTDIMPELIECRSYEAGTNKYLIIVVLDNNKNKTFCYLYDHNKNKEIDLRKLSKLYFD